MLNYTFFYGLGDFALGKYWGMAIATYLFLGGLAGGMYIAGYFAYLYKEKSAFLKEVSKFGIFASGIILILGLISLIYDHPNVLIALVNPTLFRNLNSWLAIGSWIILFFLIIWFVLVLENYGKLKLPEKSKLAVMGINAFLAFMVILYTALLLRYAMFVPLWLSNSLPFLFVASGISTGIAACSIYGILKVRGGDAKLKLADAVMIALELLLIGVLISELSGMSTLSKFPAMSIAAKQSLYLLLEGSYSSMFLYGFIGLGIIVPLLFYALSFLRKSLLAEIVSSVGVLAGGYFFRIVIVAAAAKTLVLP